MKIGLYPGSFDPWHAGHEDIVKKALDIFDKVVVCRMNNPEKPDSSHNWDIRLQTFANTTLRVSLVLDPKEPLVVDIATTIGANAIIRGLRNGYDLQYEMNQQYWNEDLGLAVPVVYFITDRNLSHISSSALRGLKKLNALERAYR